MQTEKLQFQVKARLGFTNVSSECYKNRAFRAIHSSFMTKAGLNILSENLMGPFQELHLSYSNFWVDILTTLLTKLRDRLNYWSSA